PLFEPRPRVNPRSVSAAHHLLLRCARDTSIFPLTRVTRIFQKNVFTKTSPAGPAGAVAGFLLRARERRRCGFRLGGFRPEAYLLRDAHVPQSAGADNSLRRCPPLSP